MRALKIIVILFILFLFLLNGCGSNKNQLQDSANADVSFIATSLPEVELASDVIVKATVLTKNSSQILGIRNTELKVQKVFYGDSKIGDIITITESLNVENYAASKHNRDYIFFLSRYPEDSYFYGLYSPSAFANSRFPYFDFLNEDNYVDFIDNFTNEELSLGNEDSSWYRAIFKAVFRKYFQ